jgi:DNA topoisomerase IB
LPDETHMHPRIAAWLEELDSPSAARVASIRLGAYFSVGDQILYGKYKNKKGIVVRFYNDDRGIPTVEIEPVPKGRKKNRQIGVFKIWHADLEKRAGRLLEFPDRQPRAPKHSIAIGGTKYALSSDGGPLGEMTDEPWDEGHDGEGPRVIQAPVSARPAPYRFLWAYDTERGDVGMWRVTDGNEKVYGGADSFRGKLVKLDGIGQLNRVTTAEMRAIEREMRKKEDEHSKMLQDWIKDHESDYQRFVNQVAQEVFDRDIAPAIERRIAELHKGVIPFGFKVIESILEHEDELSQMKGHVISEETARFTDELIEAEVRRRDVDPDAEGHDMQAAHWAIGDIVTEAWRRFKRASPSRVAAKHREAASWGDQELTIRGRVMPLSLVAGGKLYHGSPNEIRPGTVLVPGGGTKNYDRSSGKAISITSDAGVAGHWGSLERTTTGYIYEVEPIGEVEGWRVGPANGFKNFTLYEGRVPKARVLRLVDVVKGRRASQDQVPSPSRLAAKYQKKKKVKTQDGDEVVVYEYSEGQVGHRNREKAKRIEKLRQGIGKLRTQVKKDLGSTDPNVRLTALAVALIDETYERVGNDGSAKDGHFGVTGWTVDHISFSGSKATLKYTGKSGVDQKKSVTNAKMVSALKAATKGKNKSETILCEGDDCRITATEVNAYLEDFDITAKDIRGLHANEEMKSELKKARKGTLPSDKKEREAKLKEEFKTALEAAASAVGHEAATLKSQYLVPGLEDAFMKDGTVPEKLDKTSRLGPNTPLMERPDAKVKYRVKTTSDGIYVAVYYGRTKIGGMNAFVKKYPEQDSCGSDVWKLLEQHPQVEDTSRERWVPNDGVPRTNTRALQVYKAFITDETKHGMGIGKAMYAAMMGEWFKKVGPFLFMPMSCGGASGTSPDAKRVWDSLARRFPSSGDVVAVLKRPALPAEVKLGHTQFALKTATDSDAEKEDKATEALIHPSPKKKPPRNDLRKRTIDTDDGDDGDEKQDQKDQSQNWKDGSVMAAWDRLAKANRRQRKKNRQKQPKPDTTEEHGPGDTWQAESGNWSAKNTDGDTQGGFPEESDAKTWLSTGESPTKDDTPTDDSTPEDSPEDSPEEADDTPATNGKLTSAQVKAAVAKAKKTDDWELRSMDIGEQIETITGVKPKTPAEAIALAKELESVLGKKAPEVKAVLERTRERAEQAEKYRDKTPEELKAQKIKEEKAIAAKAVEDFAAYQKENSDTELTAEDFAERLEDRVGGWSPDLVLQDDGTLIDKGAEALTDQQKTKRLEEEAEEIKRLEDDKKSEGVEGRVSEATKTVKKLLVTDERGESELPSAFQDKVTKRLSKMNPAEREEFMEGFATEVAEYPNDPPMGASAIAAGRKALGADFRKMSPSDSGKAMAAAFYAERVTFNPLMLGGRNVSEETEPSTAQEQSEDADRILERSLQAKEYYGEMKDTDRAKAIDRCDEALRDLDPESPRAMELTAIKNGISMAAILKGEDPDGVDVPDQFSQLAIAMSRIGEENRLLGSISDFQSPAAQEAVRQALQTMTDRELGEYIGGVDGDHPMAPLVEAMFATNKDGKSALSPMDRAEVRKWIEDSVIEDIAVLDPLLGDALEANGMENTSATRAKLLKEVTTPALSKAKSKIQAAAGVDDIELSSGSDNEAKDSTKELMAELAQDRREGVFNFVDGLDVVPETENVAIAKAMQAEGNANAMKQRKIRPGDKEVVKRNPGDVWGNAPDFMAKTPEGNVVGPFPNKEKADAWASGDVGDRLRQASTELVDAYDFTPWGPVGVA